MKITHEHFTAFEAEARRMIALLGLKDWDIGFAHTRMNGAIACATFDAGKRTATLELNTEVDELNAATFCPLRFARHEVLELLLDEITDKLGDLSVAKRNAANSPTPSSGGWKIWR